MESVKKLQEFLDKNELYDDLRHMLSDTSKLNDNLYIKNQGEVIKGIRYLKVKITDGKGILPIYKHMKNGKLFINIIFNNQWYNSPNKITYSIDPNFYFLYYIPMQSTYTSMLSIDELYHNLKDSTLQLQLCYQSSNGLHRHVLSVNNIEWRKVFIHGKINLSIPLIKLNNIQANNMINKSSSLGIINMDLCITPLKLPLSSNTIPIFIEKKLIENYIHKTIDKQAHIKQKFHIFIKAWWNDYISLNKSFSTRNLQLYALNSSNEHEFVCRFLYPLHSQTIPSAKHALRMVRLIEYQSATINSLPNSLIINQSANIWHSNYDILVQKSANKAEHAMLLCCLLLGYGMNAYVVNGTILSNYLKQSIETNHHINHDDDDEFSSAYIHDQDETASNMIERHYWVMTQNKETLDTYFWEPLTGMLYSSINKTGLADIHHPFKHIYSIWSNKEFYANIQETCVIDFISYDLLDINKWKSIDQRAINILNSSSSRVVVENKADVKQKYQYQPSKMMILPSCSFNSIEIIKSIQIQLQQKITLWRSNEYDELNTIFDDQFSYILKSTLFSYEQNRIDSQLKFFNNNEFENSIKNYIPKNYIFKAIPFQFTCYENIDLIFKKYLLKHIDVIEILSICNQIHLRYGISIQLFPYAVDIYSLWIMIAAYYPKNDE